VIDVIPIKQITLPILFIALLFGSRPAVAQSPLFVASTALDIDRIDSLVQAGANVDEQDPSGASPLMLVLGCRNPRQVVDSLMLDSLITDCVALLLVSDCNVALRDSSGTTALHYAASNGRTNASELLLNRRADPNARNNSGHTPLFWATTPAIVYLLLDDGADINAIDSQARTALHQAANRNDIDVLEALLESGADPNLRDKTGKLAVDETSDKLVKQFIRSYM
jgi:ankyrin repeat protein